MHADKNAFDGLKWTNEKKLKSTSSDNGATEEKKCENGGCTDSSISTADPETISDVKEKENVCTYSNFVKISKIVLQLLIMSYA